MTLRRPYPKQTPISLPDVVAETVTANCTVCKGEGWVCESHPTRSWETGLPSDCRCGAPGEPCVCTGLS